MQKIRSKTEELRADNQGSTMIIVLVTLAFVSILVAVLVFSAFTTLQMKKVDRQSKANFYDAETAINEVRSGVQQAVSAAIAKAYSAALIQYGANANNSQQVNFFTTQFLNEFNATKNNNAALFATNGTTYTYDKNVLKNYITSYTNTLDDSNPSNAGLILSADGTKIDLSGSSCAMTEDTSFIVLKGVSVIYTKKGYESKVTADIKIQLPSYSTTTSGLSFVAAPDYAIIANTALQQTTGGAVTVSGSTYAGSLTVGNAGNALNITNANTFVTRGLATIASGASLTVSPNSALWASGLSAGAGCNVNLQGNTYLSNDLSLAGAGAAVTLSGGYYGYGNSSTDPSQSSSIIVNAKNTSLNMTGLRSLFLAGHSFINFGNNGAASVLMGESVSVKSDQLAYLIPASCISNSGGNPMAVSSSLISTDYLNNLKNNVSLTTAILGTKTLTDYIVDKTGVLTLAYPIPGTGQSLVYYYMKFPDTTRANTYFTDYFNTYKNDPTKIQNYLSLYSSNLNVAANSVSLAGDALTYTNSQLGLLTSGTVSQATVTQLKTMYQNLCATLTTTTAGNTTPYEYLVKTAAVTGITGSKTYYLNNVPYAIIASGDYTVSASTPSTIGLIVASGNVTVNKDFSGMIIANGTVTLTKSVTANKQAVTMALAAMGDDVSVYLNFSSGSFSGNGSGGSIPLWDNLVDFTNWSKDTY